MGGHESVGGPNTTIHRMFPPQPNIPCDSCMHAISIPTPVYYKGHIISHSIPFTFGVDDLISEDTFQPLVVQLVTC